MDREGFRNRLKQYKEARGLNPLLKYWEWKQKYDSAPQPDSMPGQSQPDLPTVAPQPLDGRAHRWDNEHYVDPVNTVFDADRYRSWKEPALKTFGKRVKFTYRDFMKTADVKHMKFLQSIGRLGNMLKGASIFSEVVQNLFPSEESERIEDLRVKMDKQNKWLTGLEDIPMYDEGGEVEPDPLEVLERSKPRVAGIPINDKPLSGTDPIGEAVMWGLGGGAASAALRSMFPTYGATAGWLAFGDNNKDNMLVIPNNPTRNTTPIETGLLNKEVRQYYADDVLPRDILTSEADKLKFLNTDKNFEYDLYPSGYFNGNVAGHYDSYADKIRLNGGYTTNKDLLDNVMAHEVNHRYNREFPLDKEHNRILNRAYTVEPDLDTPAARAARKPSEKRATNVNIRHKLQTDLRNTLGHNPTKAEMDKFIDSLSDLELLDRLGSASSYGSAYLMSIEDRADLVKQPADQYKKARTTALRKALKRIAMNENKNDNNQNYA